MPGLKYDVYLSLRGLTDWLLTERRPRMTLSAYFFIYSASLGPNGIEMKRSSKNKNEGVRGHKTETKSS